jgi:hypothetical protein
MLARTVLRATWSWRVLGPPRQQPLGPGAGCPAGKQLRRRGRPGRPSNRVDEGPHQRQVLGLASMTDPTMSSCHN